MKRGIITALAIVLITFSLGLYFKNCSNAPVSVQKEYINTDSLQNHLDSLQRKYDSLEAKKAKELITVKNLTRIETKIRYKTIPKVVWYNDTAWMDDLTPIDTCEQTLVYYHTELQGTKELLRSCKDISKAKTKALDTTIHALSVCKLDNEALRKKAKKKNTWQKIGRWAERTAWALALIMK